MTGDYWLIISRLTILQRNDYLFYILYFSIVIILLSMQVAWGFSPARYLKPGFNYLWSVYSVSTGVISNFRTNLRGRRQLVSHLLELETQVDELRAAEKKLALVRAENKRLRNQLDLPPSPSGQLIAAEVLHSNLGAWERSLTINQGYSKGIQVGYPVLEHQGDSWILRGVVKNVKRNSSDVILVTDPRFKIGVEIEGVAARQFVLHGRGFNDLVIPDFPGIISVSEGMAVTTGSASSIAPAGLQVGYVKQSIEAADSGPGKELRVRPVEYEEFPRLIWVLRTE